MNADTEKASTTPTLERSDRSASITSMLATETDPDPVGDENARSNANIDRYGLILLSIAATYVLASAITSGAAQGLVLVAQITTVWLVFQVSDSRRSVLIVANLLLALGIFAAIGEFLGLSGEVGDAILFGAASLLYLIAPLAILRHVLSRRTVDLQTLLAAIAAYLLIGMFFAFAFRVIGAIDSSPFYGPNGDGTMSENLFFSFTTLLTIGYGNLVPASWPGQTLAVAEGLIGSLFLVVAVAKVVSSWRPADRQG